MKKRLPTNYETGTHVLNQLFAAQSMLHVFPNARRMDEFAVQALKNIPGVDSCSFCLRGEVKPLGDVVEAALKLSETIAEFPNKQSPSAALSFAKENLIVLPLLTVDYFFGYVLLSIVDKKDFVFFESAVSNFINVLAVHLENIEYQSQVKSHHDELQSKIDEKTDELRAEIDRRKLFEYSLQVQKNEFEAIFELVPAQIWYKDTQNRFIRVNRQVCLDIGLTKMRLKGIPQKNSSQLLQKNILRMTAKSLIHGSPNWEYASKSIPLSAKLDGCTQIKYPFLETMVK